MSEQQAVPILQFEGHPLDEDQENPGLVLDYLEDSRSIRVLWLLEELGLQYKLRKHFRDEHGRATQVLLKVTPLAKAPILTDGELNMPESGAIIQYLLKKYGNGRFACSPEHWLNNLYYEWYAEGSLHPTLIWRKATYRIPQNAPPGDRASFKLMFGRIDHLLIGPQLRRHAGVIDTHLEKIGPGKWIAGGDDHPTSADFMFAHSLRLLVREMPENITPAMQAYLNMVSKRPAYQRAIAIAGEPIEL